MNPSPSLQGALWSGNQQLATKRQLLSSISGLYTDIQDINISSINVTTLGASTFNGSFVSLSTLQLKGIDIGGLNFSFDLGLGDAIGGALAGLGAAVGGAFVGLGTGVGLAVQGLETGLATLITGRGDNFINNTTFETINGTTQLQISTLGNAYPFYSSIFRSVSSVNPNVIPGQEVFLSTIFPAGTTCIRAVSDPLNIITGNSNIASSTIQSFGQWSPLLDPTNTGEDIFGRNATFSTFYANVPLGGIALNVDGSNAYPGDIAIYQYINMTPTTNSYNTTSNALNIANSLAQYSPLTALTYGNNTIDFISTPYTQYTSTIGNYTGGVYFLTSSITNQSTIPKIIYNGSIFGGANFAVCEPDETGFRSSFTMDLVAQSSNITFQWGLAVNNLNSTIAQGTAKRVSWNIPANTSNFIDIPQPASTIVANTFTNYQMKLKPFEIEIDTIAVPDNGSGGGRAAMAFNINRATFGEATTFLNQPNYPYQFNNNVFVNGILEADTFIAISSIINVSTNIQTFFSTQTFDADEATISSLTITSLLTSPNAILSNATLFSSAISSLAVTSLLTSPAAVINSSWLNSVSANRISTGNLFAFNATITNPTFSTINLSSVMDIGLTSLVNYPGVITALTSGGTTAPVVGIGFKAQIQPDVFNQTRVDYNWDRITGTSNGLNFYDLAVYTPTNPGSNLWTIGNTAIVNTSTLNVNTISTTSHSGNDITANTITILSNLSFPNVQCNATPLVMTLSNTNSSNVFTSLQTNIIQGAAFPQQSNQFSITHSGSNTLISDKEGISFDVLNGGVNFLGGVDVVVSDGDLSARSVKYGTTTGGFLQPRAFTMSKSISFGSGQSTDDNFEIMDAGSNTFPSANYNFLPAIQGFYIDNGAVAFNEVVIAPFSSNNNWWVQITTRVNAGAAGADGTITWNCLLFPYNMMT